MAEKEPITLAADTSADVLRLALQMPGRPLLSRSGRSRSQEELLLKFLDCLTAKAGITVGDIKRVAVIRGPGRFTGIRIGLTVAGMLSRLSGAKARGVTMFEALARQLERDSSWLDWLQAHPGGRLAVVTHAFREEYFCALFRPGKKGALEQEGAPQWLALPALDAFLSRSAGQSPLLCAGVGEKCAQLPQLLKGGGPQFLPPGKCMLSMSTLVALARGRTADFTLEPLYLKPAKYELL